MNSKDKRDNINSIMRWIAYTVYPRSGVRGKFSKAYDKLSAKVLIDHDFSISELTASPKSKANNLFDVLCDEELEMVLVSARSLQKMYNDALEGVCN